MALTKDQFAEMLIRAQENVPEEMAILNEQLFHIAHSMEEMGQQIRGKDIKDLDSEVLLTAIYTTKRYVVLTKKYCQKLENLTGECEGYIEKYRLELESRNVSTLRH